MIVAFLVFLPFTVLFFFTNFDSVYFRFDLTLFTFRLLDFVIDIPSYFCKRTKRINETVNTKEESVNFVVRLHETDEFRNEHWQTFDELCHPCAIDYDFIGGFENLEKEVRHILEISGLKQAANITEIKTSKTSSKIPFFYSQLSKQLLNRLKRIFRGDSEMFEYDIPVSIFSGNTGGP